MPAINRIKKGSHFTQKSFPCSQCGANLVFCADEDALKCSYCGYINKITPPPIPIEEYDFNDTVAKIESNAKLFVDKDHTINCPSCGAGFELKAHVRSTRCPYCHNPVVTNLDIFMPLAPESLLPFDINQKDAKVIFKKWVGSLWFAPNELKKFTKTEHNFQGIYLPYWTYDSQTTNHYKGQRGDIYYEKRYRRVYIEGRERTIEESVAKIRWTPVRGTVRRYFDDVLIGATLSIPRKLADSLEPWDLENLEVYDEKFLSGFDSEVYQVSLDTGFEYAKQQMEYIIREAVRYQIGGDQQQITSLRIYHENTTFKYILLPIWTAHFKYKKKDYRFAINARTGVIKGERPYSKLKIFLLIFAILVIVGGFLYFADLEQIEDNFEYQSPQNPFHEVIILK